MEDDECVSRVKLDWLLWVVVVMQAGERMDLRRLQVLIDERFFGPGLQNCLVLGHHWRCRPDRLGHVVGDAGCCRGLRARRRYLHRSISPGGRTKAHVQKRQDQKF